MCCASRARMRQGFPRDSSLTPERNVSAGDSRVPHSRRWGRTVAIDSATLSGDCLSDETPVRSLCSRMVCTRCGMIGADVRPDWGPHVNRLAGA
jgi:hypothetical protein